MFSSLTSLSPKQQTYLLQEVAKIYVREEGASNEALGQRMREALVPLLKLSDPMRPVILGTSVYFGVHELDLMTRPQMLRLYEIFLRSPEEYLERDHVLEQIYNVKIEKLSRRMLSSLRNNLVKLVSRARACANASLGESYGVQEWFLHDYRTRSWCLMRRDAARSSLVTTAS